MITKTLKCNCNHKYCLSHLDRQCKRALTSTLNSNTLCTACYFASKGGTHIPHQYRNTVVCKAR